MTHFIFAVSEFVSASGISQCVSNGSGSHRGQYSAANDRIYSNDFLSNKQNFLFFSEIRFLTGRFNTLLILRINYD